MSRELKTDDHRAVIDQALKEAYQAVEEAKALIRQQDHDAAIDTVETVEGQLDRVEAAITLMHGDVLELNNIVQELRQQRDDTLRLIRAVLGRLMN
jgi:hypothetical protein